MLTRILAAVAALVLAVGPQAVADGGAQPDGTRVTGEETEMTPDGTRVTGHEGLVGPDGTRVTGHEGLVGPDGTRVTGRQAGPEHHRGCERSFDRAARLDMELFRDYEAQAWRDMHHPDAETVFASGFRAVGVDAIMAALASHFEDREAIFEWTELSRFVDRTCHSGLVVYETRYRVPSTGFDQTALTTVMFVRDRGQWQVIYDQGTELP